MNNRPIKEIAQESMTNTSVIAITVSFALSIAPHFMHLPFWVSGFILFSLCWRNIQQQGKLPMIPKWLLVPLVVVGGVSVFAQYWTITGRDAGLALLAVMASFKFLESRSLRDSLILVFLCYFILATHFLFTQSILIALYMLLVLVVITTTLVTINMRESGFSHRITIIISSKMILLSIPIMIMLFILVPRIPGPLWGLTQEQRGGVTGLSDTLSPGEISNLIRSNEVAFRATFDTGIPSQEKLYWRGPIMAGYDGKGWFQLKQRRQKSTLNFPSDSGTSEYTITLEPHGKKWLFGLDIPVKTIQGSYLTSEFQLTSKKPLNDMKRYSLSSRLNYQLGLNESFDYLLKTTEYNPQYNPKTVALGKQWSSQFNSDIEIVNHALNLFRTQPFIYTLKPPRLGRDASDDFLFNTRKGFCEHYASSFALLMRAANIPTRVVTGYQGGELNEVGNYLIVRQSDAHAWTEVWLDDRGWLRVDPTAAVSPDRIEKGLDQALNNELSRFKIGKYNTFLSKILYNWDNLQHTWNAMVLNYDHKKQARFLNNIGLGVLSWADMILTLLFSLLTITGLYWFISWFRERPAPPPSYEKIIRQLYKKLARKGLVKRRSEHVYEFLERIQSEQKINDDALKTVLATYSKIKYAKDFQKQSILNYFQKLVSEY